MKGKRLFISLSVLLVLGIQTPLFGDCPDAPGDGGMAEASASDCSGWTLQTPTPTSADLYAVWANTPSNVFVMGEGGIILRYDGAIWETMESPTTNDILDACGSCGNSIFALGKNGPLLYYDGFEWSQFQSYLQYKNISNALWADKSSNIYLGGYHLVAMFDGTAWHYSDDDDNIEHVEGMWASSPSDVFTVGTGSRGYGGIIQHFNGQIWSRRTFDSNDVYWLNAVWGSASDDVFAVGSGGIILHFDGNSWTAMDSGTVSWLSSIWGSGPNDVQDRH